MHAMGGPARLVVGGIAIVGLAACRGGPAPPGARGFWFPSEGRIVDLTRPEGEEARPTTLATALDGVPGGTTIERLEPGRCIAPLVVLDVRARAAQAPELVFAVEDLVEHEGRRGEIPAGSVVVLATGGGQNSPRTAAAASRRLHAGFSPAVVDLLVRQRGVVGIGTDAPALDSSSAGAPEATRAAVVQGAWVLTNLARLDQLVDGRGIVLLVPPLQRSAAAAVRVFAIAPRSVGRGGP